MLIVRTGDRTDFSEAIAVWRRSNEARRGTPVPTGHEERVKRLIETPGAFLVVAEEDQTILGMAVGMQGLEDDGAGPPIPGLCHISMVFVAPEHWGKGFGGQVVDEILDQARGRGYGAAQLWTHVGNERAVRLYEARAFKVSGRQKEDDEGLMIMHLEREL